jgi:hypothetical protein
MDPGLFQLAQRAAAHPGRGSGRGGDNDRAKPDEQER